MTVSEIRTFLLRNKIPLHMDLITSYEEDGFEAGYDGEHVYEDVLSERAENTIDELQRLCGKRKFDKQLREDLKTKLLELYDSGYEDGEVFRI